jgi:predicted O-methyltransferase YrrM
VSVSRKTWTAVDRYITDTLVGPDPVLDAAIAASNAAGLPTIAVSPNEGRLLHILAKAIGARRILEIGTLGGYSTIWLARALPADGRLITLEYSPKHAEVAKANLARAGLADRTEVRVGPAIEALPRLESEGAGPFDLVFIDADKTGYPDYLGWAIKLTRPGSLIIADNVVRGGAIVETASADESIRATRRYNELVAAEPRLSATIMSLASGKGFDGMNVAFVVG